MVDSCVWREKSWFQCHVRQGDSERLETEFELKIGKITNLKIYMCI